MAHIRTFILALLLIAGISPAAAQQFPTVPSGTVIGRTQAGTGPAQAIPFATLIATMLASSPTIPTINTSSILFAGSVSGTATLKAQSAAGTPTIQLPTGSGTLLDSVTAPLTATAAGNVSCPNCALAVSTRANAISQNLSAYSYIKTTGYNSAGDGGEAAFQNVGSAPFKDSFVTAISTTGAGTSGCTNGTYRGVQPSGGTGIGLTLTVTVSGNVVTAATITGTGGNAYTAGDSLSTTITGCATSVTFSVTTVSTPTGSFTDNAGTHWQIIVGLGNFVNVKQFGAKVDRGTAGSDGAATNDWQAIQNAMSFASLQVGSTFDGGGSVGQTVIVPHGTALFCNGSISLLVPYGVVLRGQTATGSSLKLCDSGMDAGTAPINVCDPNTHLACFGAKLQNIVIYANTTPTANSNIPMVFSNSIQQFDFLDTVFIYAGNRSCINYDTGYGGAAYVGMVNVECTIASTNPGINFTNVGTTILKIKDSHVEAGGSGVTANGIQHSGGFLEINGLHTEGISTGIFTNVTSSTSNGAMRALNLSGGAHCTNLVLKQGGSVASDLVVGNAVPNGCTNTVNNGGTLTTTPVIANTTY